MNSLAFELDDCCKRGGGGGGNLRKIANCCFPWLCATRSHRLTLAFDHVRLRGVPPWCGECLCRSHARNKQLMLWRTRVSFSKITVWINYLVLCKTFQNWPLSIWRVLHSFPLAASTQFLNYLRVIPLAASHSHCRSSNSAGGCFVCVGPPPSDTFKAERSLSD